MFALTIVIPFGVPAFSDARNSQYLAKTTQAIPVTQIYTATEKDVQYRNEEIARWERLNAAGEIVAASPGPLSAGVKFERIVLHPAKSIFWSEGLAFFNGKAAGKGYLKIELVVLDLLGWDLSKNTYSLNETLTFIFRIFFPFLILILVSYFTKPEDKKRLDQFYGKMLTPVVGSHEDDERAMELTRANPARFNHLLMFPNSDWEVRRWNREDWMGVIISSLAAVSVVILLIFIVSLGRG
jgi:solute:Na+ symporter, SSS family